MIGDNVGDSVGVASLFDGLEAFRRAVTTDTIDLRGVIYGTTVTAVPGPTSPTVHDA